MRVRDHIALSTAGAALAWPSARKQAASFWAGSVLIDVDHYLWFCLRERSWDPKAAVRFFNEAQPPQHAATRVLHSPVAPLVLLLAGARGRAPFWIGLGMLAHIALDLQHELRMEQARAAALEREGFTCQVCGARGPAIGTHLHTQPWLMPSYEDVNLFALCDPCHEAAHAAKRLPA
jgi:hypothetical protein